MDWYFLSSVLFASFLLFLVYLDRKNWRFSLISVRKVRWAIEALDALARHSRFWRALSLVAMATCAFLLLDGMLMLFSTAKLIVEGRITGPTGGLLIPYPAPEFEVGYGYIRVPFWFFVALLPLVVIPHEFFHAVLMRLFGIGIKSVGIFFLAFLPGGAFVEQDQESFERASVFQKVRVCCGGSFGNFLMFLFLTLVLYLAWATPPVFVEGIRIRNVTLHSPAHQAGLREGMLIQEVDGMSLKGYLTNWTFEFELRPGDRVLLRVGNESYEVIAGEHPENETMGYLGIVYAPEIRVDLLYQHVVWLTTIQYWIAILNVLPIYPLDGGVILKAIAAKKFGRNWRKVVYPITCFFVALLLFIFIGPYFVAP